MMSSGSTTFFFDFDILVDGPIVDRRAVGEPRARLVADHLGRLVPDRRGRRSTRRVGLVRHHALGEERVERLDRLLRQMPGPLHRPGEEARVEQVQDRVLDAADVLVDVHPVVGVGHVGRRRRVRRGEAREVPARSRRRCPSCRSRAAPAPPQRGQVACAQVGCRSSGLPGLVEARRPRAAAPAGSRASPARRRRPGSAPPGSGSPSSAAGEMPQSRSRNLTTPSPMPRASQKAIAASTASSPVMPLGAGDRAQVVDRLGLRRHDRPRRRPAPPSPRGAKTSITGSPYLRAKSRSRWSCAGQPKIAPVP